MSYRSTTYYSNDQECIIKAIFDFLQNNGYNYSINSLKKPLFNNKCISIRVCSMSLEEYNKYQKFRRELGLS